jgi:hypothetical protein
MIPISPICLQSDRVFQVYIIDRNEVSDVPGSAEPKFWETKRRTVVSWSDSECVYIMVTKTSADYVLEFL